MIDNTTIKVTDIIDAELPKPSEIGFLKEYKYELAIGGGLLLIVGIFYFKKLNYSQEKKKQAKFIGAYE